MKLRDLAINLGLRNHRGDPLGCSDSNCIWDPTGGMMTQGGCQCLKGSVVEVRFELVRMARVARAAQDEATKQGERADRQVEIIEQLQARLHSHLTSQAYLEIKAENERLEAEVDALSARIGGLT